MPSREVPGPLSIGTRSRGVWRVVRSTPRCAGQTHVFIRAHERRAIIQTNELHGTNQQVNEFAMN